MGSRFAYLYRVNHSLWSLKYNPAFHSDNVVIFVHVDVFKKSESPKEAWFAWANNSLGFIEAVHQR